MRKRHRVGVATLTAALVLLPAAPARADDGDISLIDIVITQARTLLITGTYCAANGRTGASACAFDVNLLNNAERVAEVNAAADVGFGTLDTLIVGQLWSDINGGGSGYNLYSGSACSGGALRAAVPNLGGFNDITSSFYGYQSCRLQIWADASYSGFSVGPLTSSNYVGATMNDEATSVKAF